MQESRSSAVIIIGFAMVLLLFVVYVGSYLYFVDPMTAMLSSQAFAPPYRYGGQTAGWIFWPIEQIDRLIRPGFWGFG